MKIEEMRYFMGMYLNPGNNLFKIALNSNIYIDKSGLVSYVNDVINTEQRFICVSRPRRFGKSMAANMLTAYYSCGCDSKNLFDKLEIKSYNTYEDNLNKYDTIYLNIPKFLNKIDDLKKLGNYIENILVAELKDYFQNYNIPETEDLNTIISYVANHPNYKNRGFIFIIDEWDCIFREAVENTTAQKNYLNFLRNIFKDNGDIKLAYMTLSASLFVLINTLCSKLNEEYLSMTLTSSVYNLLNSLKFPSCTASNTFTILMIILLYSYK